MEHLTDECNCSGKECTKCHIVQCIGGYCKDHRLKSGLKSRCNICLRSECKEWRQENPEHNRARKRDWRRKNADRVNEQTHKKRLIAPTSFRERENRYRLKNIDKVRARDRAYKALPETRKKINERKRKAYNNSLEIRRKNKIRRRAYDLKNKAKVSETQRKYYLANRDKIREANRKRWKEYYQLNRDKLNRPRESPAQHAIRQALRRARKAHSGGSFTVQEWETLKELYNYTCLRCGRKEPEIKLTVDHVIPISLGGDSNIGNIQPLCKSCNCSKHAKIIDYRPFKTTHNDRDESTG